MLHYYKIQEVRKSRLIKGGYFEIETCDEIGIL